MNIRNEYLVFYDIADNKLRTRIYKYLLGYGLFAIQKSVFWGFVSAAEITAIQRELLKGLEEGDKACIIPARVDKKNNHTYLMGYTEEDFCDWKVSDAI